MCALLRIEDTLPKMEKCSYCLRFLNDSEILVCCKCNKSIHKSCLRCKSTPGDLLGDVFFDLTCCNCLGSTSKLEILERQKLSWFMVITLVMYNLNANLLGLSYNGYFHWRTHVISFIEKNWKYIFPPDMQRRRNWAGSVSGSLSNNSPEFFISGTEELEEGGWWKLTYEKLTPIEIYNINVKTVSKKADDIETNIDETKEILKCSRLIPYMGCSPRHIKPTMKKKSQLPLNAVQTHLLDFLAENLAENERKSPHIETNMKQENENITNDVDEADKIVRIVEITTFQNTSQTIKVDNNSDLESESEMQKCSKENLTKLDNEITNFNNNSTEKEVCCLKRKWSYLLKKIPQETQNEHVKIKKEAESEEIVPMSIELENVLRRKLHKFLYGSNFDYTNNSSALLRRFYWKLVMRSKRRQERHDIPFDFLLRRKSQVKSRNSNKIILDHYGGHLLKRASFRSHLTGYAHHERFTSVYTKRVLHPYIYRNLNSTPYWLQLMNEIKFTVNKKIPTRSPIDYCYLQPSHIAPVNALLQQMFWPGIDMSECLSTPDYTVVALYKKLLIGCGFLVPDVGLNEAYISFMTVRYGWQRAGIGSFILYHLLQTCMEKDITLHVSATNSAVVLYQKFGFKIEEVCLNFYEKFMPPSSKDSRNAFFLRLSR